MNLKKAAFLGMIILIGIGFTYVAISDNSKVQKENTKHDEIETYNNVLASPHIPEKIEFCGEEVPIEVYWVREGLEKELIIHCYQHSKTIQTFKRSTRYFPEIEKILKEEGVPLDMKYLCIAESNIENVVSPAKASGYWQFMNATGSSYGLEINDHVDERYHIEKSTRAACTYLKALKNRFGSWTLAAAAYNMGEGGVQRTLNEQGNNLYWDLHLNTETSRYISRIVSYKLMFEDPEKYGVTLKHTDYYQPIPYYELTIDTSISNLMDFAKANNILYRELKELNPWIRSKSLIIKGKKYILRVPIKSKLKYNELFVKED